MGELENLHTLTLAAALVAAKRETETEKMRTPFSAQLQGIADELGITYQEMLGLTLSDVAVRLQAVRGSK